MGKVRFVYISGNYVDYLSKALGEPKYLAEHKEGRIFVEFPYLINGHIYCIPLSSPKFSDYYNSRSGKKCIKKDSLHVLKLIYEKASIKHDKLKGTLRFGKMIPAPMSEIIPYNPKNDPRPHYAYLVGVQKRCLKDKYDVFIDYAVSLYNMKVGAIPQSRQFKNVEKKLAALEFRDAEHYCSKYKECLEKGIPREKILEAVMSETDGERKGESQSRHEQPGCSSWGASTSSHGEDKHRRKRKYSERHHDEERRSVRRKLSDSKGEGSRKSSHSRSRGSREKGVGKVRSRHTPTR